MMDSMMMSSLLLSVLSWLIMLVLIGAVIWVVLWFVRRIGGINILFPLLSPSPETPLDILQRRFAQGEIDIEQFTRIKERLNQP